MENKLERMQALLLTVLPTQPRKSSAKAEWGFHSGASLTHALSLPSPEKGRQGEVQGQRPCA